MYPLWSSVFAVIANIGTCVYVAEIGCSWYGCSLRAGQHACVKTSGGSDNARF